MKKVLLLIAIVAAGFTANAQDAKSTDGQTAKGKFLIEGNTGFGAHASNTGFYLSSSDGETSWGVGAEGGYFVADDLAVKVGLGYNDASEAFTYKVGAKYYINSMIPVQIDLSGLSVENASPMYLGIQGGYAIFLGDMVSIEPGFRYNYGIGDAKDNNNFQFNVGFALHI